MLKPSTRLREENHRRTITIDTFECEDGTIEIELALVDVKRFEYVDRERGMLGPSDPVHAINVRLSISRQYEVLAIETDLEAMPFSYCQLAAVRQDKLIGARLDKGWRHAVRDALGATNGCTHLAELLPLASTVAFQTEAISRKDIGLPVGRNDSTRPNLPFFVGGCHTWAADSPVTRKHFPQFNAPATKAKDGGE